MNITKSEFDDFEQAQKIKLDTRFFDVSAMSRERWKMTSLSVNKYIYIADHYEELKEKFEKGSEKVVKDTYKSGS